MAYNIICSLQFRRLFFISNDPCTAIVYILQIHVFFFFQAEDGIRDDLVTGVQTCALPIYLVHQLARIGLMSSQLKTQELIQLFYSIYNPEASEGQKIQNTGDYTTPMVAAQRSEERRVGKECRSRWSPYH